MVRTVKRANTDDRWKVVSPRDPYSAADLGSTPAEFSCSRETRGEVNPAAQRFERHPVDDLPQDPNRDPVPRRLYLKQSDFMAHGTSDRCPGCRALVSGGRAQGHTEECRIRVERNFQDRGGKVRLRAATSRVGDAPTGRALKIVRFAADRVGDDAEAPEDTSASAPSSLPAEAASSNSLPAPGPSASATDSPDQVMSEGASSAPDAAVELSMKRSSDNSLIPSRRQRDSILITPRLWTILMLVERLNGVVKSVVAVRRFLSM